MSNAKTECAIATSERSHAKAKIAVLVSGGGTNLQALIDAERSGIIKSGTISLVISNKKSAYALERAANAGIEAFAITRKSCGGQEGFERRLIEEIESRNIDLIIMAGFMSILSEDFTRHFDHRIINIHPSLIPSFCGKGYYQSHRRDRSLRERDPRRRRDHHAESRRSAGRRHTRNPAETRHGTSRMDHPAPGGRENMRADVSKGRFF